MRQKEWVRSHMAKKSTKKSSSEQPEEHRVFSHLMYLLFLISAAMAAYYTFGMLIQPPEASVATEFYGVKALVFLGWSFVFKTLGHRIHLPEF